MNIEDLGRRAVACAHWRWMPGMLLLPHIDGCECCEDRNFPRRAARIPAVFTTDIDVPDLSDPATLGCLLALVREAWPDEWHEFMVPIFDGFSHWYVGCLMPGTSRIVIPTRVMQTGLLDALPPKPTEAEALVAALEAAP